MKKKILVVAAALLCAPMMADLAQANAGYLIGKVGVYLPDDSKVDTGFNGEIGYGFNLLPPRQGLLAVEGTIGYLYAEQSDRYYPDNGASYRMKFQADVVPLALSLKAGIQSGPFTFYVGGGVDLLFVSMDAKYNGGYYYGYRSSDSDSDTVWGGHVMAGITFDINPNMFVGAEAKYMATQDMSMSFFDRYSNANFSGDLNGVTISGVFGFRF
jgi:opacity protein-like surface antigen